MACLAIWIACCLAAGPALAAAQELPLGPHLPPPAAAGRAGSSAPEDAYLPSGRGFDWTLTGYQEGRAAVPDPPPTLNARTQFGARGDGVMDDTAALQAALRAAHQNPGGGVVLLPPGTYILTKPLLVSRGRVVIRGAAQGQSVIHIPVSLSDVFQGTWALGPDGTVSSSWSFGGAFVTFRGIPHASKPATLLASIISPVVAGSTRIPVDSTAKLRVGQRVRVYVNDASSEGRRRSRRLLASQAAANISGAWPSSSSSIGPTVRGEAAPDWVQQDPIYQAAMEGIHSLGNGGVGGLSAEEALEAEAEAFAAAAAAVSAEGPPQDSGLLLEGSSAQAPAPEGASAGTQQQQQQLLPTGGTRMAPAGSLAAWLYGDNMVDSGTVGEVLDRDEVSMPARVVAVGVGWIELERGIPFPVRAGWRGEVHWDAPYMQDSGIENLTIRFRHTPAARHFADRGYNALQFSHGSNCWVRNVTILNADNGLFFSWMDRSTIRGVTVGAVPGPRVNPQHPESMNGHHAISLTSSHSSLLASWWVANRYIHDVTLASGASLNVLTGGGGVDMNIDMHRTAPYGNLLTDINTGGGTRAFHSGGRQDRGAHSGRSNTFWNVRSGWGAPLALPSCDFGPLLNFYGSFGGDRCAPKLWLVQPLPPGSPPNLYDAQRKVRWQQEAAARRG